MAEIFKRSSFPTGSWCYWKESPFRMWCSLQESWTLMLHDYASWALTICHTQNTCSLEIKAPSCKQLWESSAIFRQVLTSKGNCNINYVSWNLWAYMFTYWSQLTCLSPFSFFIHVLDIFVSHTNYTFRKGRGNSVQPGKVLFGIKLEQELHRQVPTCPPRVSAINHWCIEAPAQGTSDLWAPGGLALSPHSAWLEMQRQQQTCGPTTRKCW